MNIQRWIARRETDWKRLDALLGQVEKKGIKSLKAEEIATLASLYRSVAADFARARTQQVGNLITQNLQSLTTRGYNQIYQGSRRQEWQAVKEFYRTGLPLLIQQTSGYIALATGIFLFGAAIAWWYAWQDPAFLPLIVPQELITKVRDKHELWMGSIVGIEPLASSGITINNISVSFLAAGSQKSDDSTNIYVLL